METSRLQLSLDTDINFTAQYSSDLFYLASLKQSVAGREKQKIIRKPEDLNIWSV